MEQVNAELAQYNTRIDQSISINFTTAKVEELPLLSTSKLNPKMRKPAKSVVCTYCPICGKKYA
jgi:hypothetical protein